VKNPADLTLTEIARALRRRTFSSTELTQWMLERIARWQPVLNAFVRVIGRPFGDELLIALGRGFQAETDHHRRLPALQ
jgi:Asp-tRNA(Asn)/Glu-tRNA(Gln) amidotransferase A subunit family amidase